MLDNKFSKGDLVKAKRDGFFWMTIVEVRPFGFYECRFGYTGGRAGTFKENEIELAE